MRGILKFLGKAAAGIGDVVSSYRTRKIRADFDRKLRDEIAANKCSNCAAPVGQQPFRDPDFPGCYYCSFDCLNSALIRRDSELDEKMTRQPGPLTEDEQALLVGKSSPGMHYERGRCVQCGDPLRDGGAIFAFCSERCEEKAMRPYVTFTQQLADCDEYMKAVRDRQDFFRKQPEIIDEVKKRCEKKTMTDGEIQAYLDRQVKLAELLYDRRKSLDYGEARVSFLKKWERQRGYVLEQEKRRDAKSREARL
jgi:ferredoxin